MNNLKPYALLVILAVLLAAPASYFALKLDQLNDEQREMYSYANMAAKKDMVRLYDIISVLPALKDNLEEYQCSTRAFSEEEPSTYVYYAMLIEEASLTSSNLESFLDVMYTVKKKPELKKLKDSIAGLSYYLDSLGKELTKSKAANKTFNCNLLPGKDEGERLGNLLRGVAGKYDDIGEINYEDAQEMYEAVINITG